MGQGSSLAAFWFANHVVGLVSVLLFKAGNNVFFNWQMGRLLLELVKIVLGRVVIGSYQKVHLL